MTIVLSFVIYMNESLICMKKEEEENETALLVWLVERMELLANTSRMVAFFRYAGMRWGVGGGKQRPS